MYSFDFDKLIENLLPWFLRKPILKSWLKSLSTPARSLYSRFEEFVGKKRWEASITGQVAVLEIMLNKEFYNDETLRKIFISDNDLEERVYLFNSPEAQAPVYLHNLNEGQEPIFITNFWERNSADFTVWVPDTLIFDINHMTGLVKKFKVAGPTFDIKTYTE